jgi:hypothetical protein
MLLAENNILLRVLYDNMLYYVHVAEMWRQILKYSSKYSETQSQYLKKNHSDIDY